MTTSHRASRTILVAAALALTASACAQPTTPDTPSGPDPTPPTPQADSSAHPQPATVSGSVPGVLAYVPQPGKAQLSVWTSTGVTTYQHEAGSALLSVRLSPDGRRVAWLRAGTSDVGTLMVANVDGTGITPLGQTRDTLCVEPAWLADGGRVMARATDGHIVVTATANGAATALRTDIQGCHIIPSADGSTVIFSDGIGRLHTARADGSGQRKVTGLGPDGEGGQYTSTDPMSVSPDGTLAVVSRHIGTTVGDVARALVANAVVNLRTGETVTLPVTGELRQAFFAPAGLLVRATDGTTTTVWLLDSNLRVAASSPEPAELTDLFLIGYGG